MAALGSPRSPMLSPTFPEQPSMVGRRRRSPSPTELDACSLAEQPPASPRGTRRSLLRATSFAGAPKGHEKCSIHGEDLLIYCRTCSQALCAVCAGLDHAAHETRTLADITHEMSREYLLLLSRSEAYAEELEALYTRCGPSGEHLHSYIDSEIDGLVEVVNTRRAELHADVDSRAQDMMAMIDAEMAKCEAELGSIEEGRAILGCMQCSEGVINSRAGQLINGGIAYDDFWALVDPPLHIPPRMRNRLHLQLPIEDMQTVCDMLAWAQTSLENQTLVFPKQPPT